jgi:hypothetical protein
LTISAINQTLKTPFHKSPPAVVFKRVHVALERYAELIEKPVKRFTTWKTFVPPINASNQTLTLLLEEFKATKNRVKSQDKEVRTFITQTRNERALNKSIDDPKSNAKTIWRIYKQKLGIATSSVPSGIYRTDINGDPTGDLILEKAEQNRIVAEEWEKVATPKKSEEEMQSPDPPQNDPLNENAPWLNDFLKPEIPVPNNLIDNAKLICTRYELEIAIENTPRDKATGSDHIAMNELKGASQKIIDIISNLISIAMLQKLHPTNWTIGLVRLIYKKDAPENPLNYRPIALLQNVYKLYTAILNKRLTDILEATNTISSRQAGFLRFRSRTEQIVDHIATINNAKQYNRELHVVYIDLK